MVPRRSRLPILGGIRYPITYAPPARDASELIFEQQSKADGPDLAKRWLQKAPARQLPNLQRMPISIVSGEASFYAAYGHCLAAIIHDVTRFLDVC
jgi:hypothetical protein